MSVDKAVIAQAIAALASLEGIWMDPRALAEDAALLTFAFPEEPAYKAAIANTVNALKNIMRGKASTNALEGVYQGWESYHYQPKVDQGAAADMRIIFKREPESIRVLGFGHRYIPSDFYRRISTLRKKR